MKSTEFIFENKTTLQDLYKGSFPDRDELFWDYVKPSEFNVPIEVKTLPKHKLNIMLLSQYRIEHLDELFDMMDDDQKEIVDRYVNDPNLGRKIIVVAGDRIIDGNHRAVAAAVRGIPINYVDLSDLDS